MHEGAVRGGLASTARSCQYEQADVPDPAKLIGQAAEFTLKPTTAASRAPTAASSIAADAETKRRRSAREPRHRPRTLELSQRADCRIFQQMSVADIVKKVLTGGGDRSGPQWKTSGTNPRDYTVQYRETDFDFVVRLLSEEGIYFVVTLERPARTPSRFSDKPDGVGPIERHDHPRLPPRDRPAATQAPLRGEPRRASLAGRSGQGRRCGTTTRAAAS